MRNISILIYLLIGLASFSQGQNDNWYFGNKAGLNFATNPPTALLNGQMNQFEGLASVSNAAGQLLFYTDGRSIWNRNHVVMANGSGLTGGYSTLQSAIIVPYPQNANLYYVFTVPELEDNNAHFIAYSIVDMTLNSGLGDVMISSKNTPLLDENGAAFYINTEAITATLNSTNSGYWVVLPRNNTLYTYSITNGGISTVPITSNMTFPTGGTFADQVSVRISPDKTKIAISRITGILKIYNFNNASGQVDTSFEVLCSNCGHISTEFSPDSSILYATFNFPAAVRAYNLATLQVRQLNNPPIQNPAIRFGAIQRSKFNDLYISHGDYNEIAPVYYFISRITNPNDYLNAQILYNDVSLSGRSSKIGLPQLIEYPPCQNSLTLSVNETNPSFSYQVSNSIITNNNYAVNSGLNINLYAGVSIDLKPNTHLKSGSNVLARIQPCSSGSNRIVHSQPVRMIFDLKESPEIFLLPNPANEFIVIKMNSEFNTITLTSLEGKTIFSKSIENSQEYNLDLSLIQNGIYILSVTTSDGMILNEKLIKK